MKTWASCGKLPKNRLARKKNRKSKLFTKVMRVQCDWIFIVVFFSHDITFQSCFVEVLTNISKRTLNSYFGKFYWNFDTFILTSHSGFTYRLVKWSTEIFNQLSSICKLQVSNLWLGKFNGIFSTATTRALGTWKFLKADNWISSVLIPKQHKTFAMK